MIGLSETPLDILNLTLAKLGCDPVDDFDNPDSTAAKKVKRLYAMAADSIQRSYLWAELHTTAELTVTVDNPLAYELPEDCLRPMGAALDFTSQPTTWIGAASSLTYNVVGQTLVVNYETDAPLELFYIRRDADVSIWSSELQDCVMYGLAVESAFLVTDNQNLYQGLEQKLQALILPKARELQSKYKKNYATYLPSGFSNLQARIG